MAETQTTPGIKSTSSDSRWSVLVVDDHPIFRQGIVQLIDSEPDLQACAEVTAAPEALATLREKKCDAAIIDISLPGTNGIELTKQIRAEHPDLPILVVSMHDETLYALRALRAGANGYIMKREGLEPFLTALRKIIAGEVYLSPTFSEQLICKVAANGNSGSTSPLDTLTDRELEVLQLLGQALSSQEIATSLNLSIKTIETHRLHIKEKLGFRDASELVRFAMDWVAQQTG